MSNQTDLRNKINEQIVTALSQGMTPWRKPWSPAKNTGHAANAVTGKLYRGVNPLGDPSRRGTSPSLLISSSLSDAGANPKSSSNLHQMALALLEQHDLTGSLPPAAVCNGAGRPLLSWRVQILPYIEHADLYNEFHLDEP
jgi:hypothetical protein